MKNILLFALLALVSCSSPKPKVWEEYPMKTAPDRTCAMGGMSPIELYIWDCQDNQHVVIYRYENHLQEMESNVQRSKCGRLTPIEEELNLDHWFKEKCAEAPTWGSKTKR